MARYPESTQLYVAKIHVGPMFLYPENMEVSQLVSEYVVSYVNSHSPKLAT